MIKSILNHAAAVLKTNDDLPSWPTDMEYVQLSAGASQMGVRSRVFLMADVLRNYREFNLEDGLNTAGVILKALGEHLRTVRTEQSEPETIGVYLRPRNTGRVVHVLLDLRRVFEPSRQACAVLWRNCVSELKPRWVALGAPAGDRIERWAFELSGQLPGPCAADAADHIEKLGFDSADFWVKTLDAVRKDDEVTCGFSVEGPAGLLDRLRAAHYSKS